MDSLASMQDSMTIATAPPAFSGAPSLRPRPTVANGAPPPSPARARNLMRSCEHTALEQHALRASALEHSAYSQLSESESLLLVEVEAALAQGPDIDPRGAGELLRLPLQQLSDGLRSILGRYKEEEGAAIKTSITTLFSDLSHVHDQETRRAREGLAHARRLSEQQLETTRRAAQTELLKQREDMRRDCEARVAEAERGRREAEAVAAAAVASHPTIDAQALLQEKAMLRVKLEFCEEQMRTNAKEAADAHGKAIDARTEAERRARDLKKKLGETSQQLYSMKADLEASMDSEARLNDQLTISNHALTDSQNLCAQLKTKLMAATHKARGEAAERANERREAAAREKALKLANGTAGPEPPPQQQPPPPPQQQQQQHAPDTPQPRVMTPMAGAPVAEQPRLAVVEPLFAPTPTAAPPPPLPPRPVQHHAPGGGFLQTSRQPLVLLGGGEAAAATAFEAEEAAAAAEAAAMEAVEMAEAAADMAGDAAAAGDTVAMAAAEAQLAAAETVVGAPAVVMGPPATSVEEGSAARQESPRVTLEVSAAAGSAVRWDTPPPPQQQPPPHQQQPPHQWPPAVPEEEPAASAPVSSRAERPGSQPSRQAPGYPAGGLPASAPGSHRVSPRAASRGSSRPVSSQAHANRARGRMITSAPSVRPRAANSVAAVSREPCASMPLGLRPKSSNVPHSNHVPPSVYAARAGLGPSAHGAALRHSAAGPPPSLVERMRQRQAALGNLIDERGVADDARYLYERASRTQKAEPRRAAHEAGGGGGGWAPTPGYGAKVAPTGGAPELERRERTFVGLNFVR